jgi:hypothetical protein
MRTLIAKILKEELSGKKYFISRLMEMGFNEDSAIDELNNIIYSLKQLPNEIILYRIIVADRKSDIDLSEIGSHYSMDKYSLIDSHSYLTGYGDNYFLIKVKAPKKLIDKNETILNNILYPNEKEITLKNKGRGVEVISIKKIKV